MNNDMLKKSMLSYIYEQPIGVMYAKENLEKCDFSIIRYIFCLLKDIERRDKKIKHLENDIDKLQTQLDNSDDYWDYQL